MCNGAPYGGLYGPQKLYLHAENDVNFYNNSGSHGHRSAVHSLTYTRGVYWNEEMKI